MNTLNPRADPLIAERHPDYEPVQEYIKFQEKVGEEFWCPPKFQDENADLQTGHYKPLSCELVSVMDEEEYIREAMKKYGVWQNKKNFLLHDLDGSIIHIEEEAHCEGFNTWAELDKCIVYYYGGRPKMWRYEFRR